jgi:HSP90 family molecular chaperone
MSEFLEEKRLKELIKRYFEFIGYLVTLYVTQADETEDSENEDVDKKKVESANDDKIKEVDEKRDKRKNKRKNKSKKKMTMVKHEDH